MRACVRACGRGDLVDELAHVALVEADGGPAGEHHQLHAELKRVREGEVRHVPARPCGGLWIMVVYCDVMLCCHSPRESTTICMK